MPDSTVDRLARLLSGSHSRRQALAALAALAATRLRPAHAAEIQTAACGASGAVCTELKGCCAGLVCATSTINPTYGVCVTGEGDMLPVSDDLIVPGSAGITDELAQEVRDAAAGGSRARSTRKTRGAKTKASKDMTTTDTTTTDTGPTTDATTPFFTNSDTRRSRKAAKNAEQKLNKPPNLTLTLVDNDPATNDPEILRVENREAVDVEISAHSLLPRC